MTLTNWGNLLPLIVFLVSAGLAVFARLKNWDVMEPPASAEMPPLTQIREPLPFFKRYRWELLLTVVIAGLLLFAVIFAPPRQTGQIPPDPNQPGRPFFSLRWEQTYLHDHFENIRDWSNVLASLLCLLPIGIAIKRRSRLHSEVALLLSSLTLAMLAQWTLADHELARIGTALYVIASLGFIYWAWLARSRLKTDLVPARIKPAWEIPLVLLLFTLTAFGRFYVLASVPYGIEGDEAKWTSEAVNLDVRGEPDISGEYHRDALPVSFYLQAPLQRLLGASLLSARLTVAILSVLASLVFYCLLRRLLPIPLAALATYLLSVSIFDISASRLANVESFVKLWAVLPLFLLAWALEKRVWQAFTLVGLALAVAALTYDTLWAVIGACLLLTIIELWKVPVQEKLKLLAALIAPLLVILPITIPYLTSRLSYYGLGKKAMESGWLAALGGNFVHVLDSWFVSLHSDFLYNRVGPLLNATLLPWLVLGIMAAILIVRNRGARWLLVWMGLVILPVPTLTNSPLGRVYYPGLPAVYGLIALGLFLVWKEIQRVFTPSLKPMLVALMLIPLVWLPLANFYIYFNEVSEPSDRQMRREISDIASTVKDNETLLVMAVVPNADEPLNNERQIVDLALMKHLDNEQAKQAVRRVALDQVMPSITNEFKDWKKLIIVLDKNSPGDSEERASLSAGLVTCYPRGELIQGRFFNQFILDEAARADSRCTPVTLNLQTQDPPHLLWTLSTGSATSLDLLCDQQMSNYVWLEAEDIPLGPGWTVEINFAPGWNGTGFLSDNYGSQFLAYEFTSPFHGTDVQVWVRTYKRVIDNSPAYLTVNGKTLPFGDTKENFLNTWNWERIGSFPNNDTIRITIARPYTENLQNFMGLFIDTFFFTDDITLSPKADLTKTIPAQHFVIEFNRSSGTILPNLPSGQYTCRAQINSTLDLVDAFGRQPVISNDVELTVP